MYLWYISDWFFVARLDMDREIPLVKETELDDFLSHIGAANEEIRFKNIQKKLLAELRKDIHIFLQHKSDFLRTMDKVYK